MLRFKDKVILITGASTGIGRAIALRLASEGGKLLCLDVNDDDLNDTVKTISDNGSTAQARHCDVSNIDEVKSSFQACVDTYGQLDVLINVAGVIRLNHATEIDDTTWQRIININLTGTFYMCREALPLLEKSRGNIVNISSTSAIRGLPYGIAYGASKGGVSALTKSIAVEYGKRGVRANTICPGSIETNMQTDSGLPDDIDWNLIPRISSLDKFGQPDDIAAMVALVASDEGKHITGAEMIVDGGTVA